jgi:TonB family protein
MFTRLLYITSASLLLSTSPAAARDWGNVGGWYVASGTNSCGMYAPNRGQTTGIGEGTEIVILKRLDGNLYLQASNASWSIVQGSEAATIIQIDGAAYTGAMNAASLAANQGRGVLAVFDENFEAALRTGTRLSIAAGGRSLADFPLSGSPAALATIQSCLDDLRSGGSNQTSAGFASLATAPIPKGIAGEWIQAGDYPSSAGSAEGTTRFRLAVGINGRVSACTITESSGNSSLDAATCQAMTRRARFEPATDTNGKKVPSEYSNKVVWKKPL